MLRWIILLSSAALLAACANPGPAPESDIDLAKMSAVERAAQKTGVKVYWITAPRKTTTTKEAAPS